MNIWHIERILFVIRKKYERNFLQTHLNKTPKYFASVKRREAKHKGEKERCTHLNAEFQRTARRDEKAFLSDQCKEIEENNRMGKTRDLFSFLAWRIPGTEEPSGLPSMGSHRVGHD